MANILLAGLEREAADAFSNKLTQLGHSVSLQPQESYSATPPDGEVDADIVFASADVFGSVEGARWMRCLARLICSRPTKPVVIVSRLAGEDTWLAALEAGATDYCACDIDVANLGWIVDNAIGRHYLTAAA